MYRITALVGCLAILFTTSVEAGAKQRSIKQKYTDVYYAVKKKQGKRAPGRNIRKHGIRYKWVSSNHKGRHWSTRPATERQYAKSIKHLRALLVPYAVARPPAQPPGQVLTAGSPGTNGHLQSIKMCESGGDYHNKKNPTYRGAYQFSYGTWASVGGSGDPADASPAEQDYRAQMLYNRSGPGQWPVCQHR